MPINESRVVRRSGLTRQQQQDAEMALYGGDMAQTTQHKDEEKQQEQIHDINNPPRHPFVFEDYPRVLYKGAENVTVPNAEEEKKHAAKGWKREPPETKPAAEEPAEEKKK